MECTLWYGRLLPPRLLAVRLASTPEARHEVIAPGCQHVAHRMPCHGGNAPLMSAHHLRLHSSNPSHLALSTMQVKCYARHLRGGRGPVVRSARAAST